MEKRFRKEDDYEQPIEALVIKELETMKLPDPDLLRQYRLMDERKIWIDENIGMDVLEVERQILLWNMKDSELDVNDRQPIWIYLFNYGGYADCSQSLIDVIDASITPVYTVNMGIAASAAAEVFIAGRRRFMLKNARVMLHQGAGAISGDAQKMRDNIEDYNRQLEKAKVFLLARTAITAEQYEQHKYNDWWLDSDECMRYGVCDRVVSSLEEVI